MKINIRMLLLAGLGLLLVFFLGTKISYAILFVGIISSTISVLGILYLKYNLNIDIDLDNTIVNRGQKVKMTINMKGGLPFYYIKVYFKFIEDIDDNYKGEVLMPNYTTSKLEKEILCIRRGIYNVENIIVEIEDILGIANYRYELSGNRELTVLPSVYNIRPNMVYSKSNVYRNTVSIMTSDDCIEGIKEYSLGDSLKKINWKATAKRGSLHVNEYRSHKGEDLFIILDMNEINFELGGLTEEEELITIFLSMINQCANNYIKCTTIINNYIQYNLTINNNNDIKELIEYFLNNYSLGFEGISNFIVKNKEIINSRNTIVIIVFKCTHELVYYIEKYIQNYKFIEIWCIENYVNEKIGKNIKIIKQEL